MPKKPYKCCMDCEVFNDAMELKVAQKRIEIYLDALEWIEDHNVASYDQNGKPISPGAVASSAREKARNVR